MKILKISAVIVIAAAIMLSCCGCSTVKQIMDDEEIREYTESMIDALIADDFDAAYAVVDDICTKEEFSEPFTGMQEMLNETDDYTLELTSIYKNSSFTNGETVSSTTASYKVIAENKTFIVNVQKNSDYEKLCGFNIAPVEKTNYYYTGTINSMKDATAVQWVMLALNLPVIGIAIFALIDCCCRKIKNKALWIIIIILGFAAIGATLSESSVKFNINIGWITSYSALIRYGGGMIVFRLMLPVGAVVYLSMRNKLIKKSETVAETVQISDAQNK